MRKAQNADGLFTRRGFATRRMAFLAATRRERGRHCATRRCTPRPDAQSGRRRAPGLAHRLPRSHLNKQYEQALGVASNGVGQRAHQLVDVALLDDIRRAKHQVFARVAHQHAVVVAIQEDVVSTLAR
jgi:hypothetical protein